MKPTPSVSSSSQPRPYIAAEGSQPKEKMWIGTEMPSLEANRRDVFEREVPGYDMRRLIRASDPLAASLAFAVQSRLVLATILACRLCPESFHCAEISNLIPAWIPSAVVPRRWAASPDVVMALPALQQTPQQAPAAMPSYSIDDKFDGYEGYVADEINQARVLQRYERPLALRGGLPPTCIRRFAPWHVFRLRRLALKADGTSGAAAAASSATKATRAATHPKRGRSRRQEQGHHGNGHNSSSHGHGHHSSG